MNNIILAGMTVAQMALAGVNPNDHTKELAEVDAQKAEVHTVAGSNSTPTVLTGRMVDAKPMDADGVVIGTKEDEKAQMIEMAEDITSKICMIRQQARDAKERIAHEKAIGKETGVVNTRVLHDQGSILVRAKTLESRMPMFLKTFKPAYKELVGTEFKINCEDE